MDMYLELASTMFAVPVEEVSRDQRSAARQYFFHSVGTEDHELALAAISVATPERKEAIRNALQTHLERFIPYNYDGS